MSVENRTTERCVQPSLWEEGRHAPKHRQSVRRHPQKLQIKIVYRRITVGEGNSFIFKKTLEKHGKSWIPQVYAPLVARYADRDQAIAEALRLNCEGTR